MAIKRVQAVVSGRVQGVGYRYYAVHTANRLGVAGTVRNVMDGEVEVIAEGEQELLNEFLGELRQGPSSATVTNMQVAWDDADGVLSGFTAEA